MIVIDIDPTMVQFGPLVIAWHGFFSTVGLAVGIAVAVWLSRRTDVSEDQVLAVSLWGVLGALIGARLVHVIDYWHYYRDHPLQILLLNEGGIAIWGAVIGGVLAGAAYCRVAGIPVAPTADLAAHGLILGQGIGRIGDIINGEHHGAHAQLPWSVVYVHPLTLGERGIPVHPAVGYELLLDFAIFGLLLALFRRVPDGVVFWVYLLLYALTRLVVGFFRLDPPVVFGLQQQQLIAIAMLVLAAAALLRQYRGALRVPGQTDSAPSR